MAALEMIAERGGLGPARGLRTVRVQPDNRHDEDAVWVLAPHDLAIALEIFGEMPQPVAAKGHWADGHLVTLHALLDIGDAWHAMEISERAPAVERRIELHCDDGLAVLAGGWDEHVILHRVDGRSERIEAAGELPLLAELRAFVEHLDGGPPPRSSVAEGAAAGAPRFTLTWMVLLVLAFAVVMTGVDPVQLTEYAVIFSVVALPLTYLPILLVANDRAYMGSHTNGRLANILGIGYLVVIVAVSLTAIPLLILTNVGQG